jgi:cell division protein FtsN
LGGAGTLWLTQQDSVELPIPKLQSSPSDGDSSQVRYEFWDTLPGEEMDFAEGVEFTPRSAEALASENCQYILQAGSFRNMEDADRVKGQLAFLGLESRVERSENDSGVWYRVRMGPFQSRSERKSAESRAVQADIEILTLKRDTGDC